MQFRFDAGETCQMTQLESNASSYEPFCQNKLKSELLPDSASLNIAVRAAASPFALASAQCAPPDLPPIDTRILICPITKMGLTFAL